MQLGASATGNKHAAGAGDIPPTTHVVTLAQPPQRFIYTQEPEQISC